MSYNLNIDANGQVNGKDLAWDMIKNAHSIQAYEYDENGNVVMVDGAAKLAYEQKAVEGSDETVDDTTKPVYDSTMSFYNQKKNADGEYIYGYCVAEDTGGLIKGNLVDLYYDTHDECIQFGRRDIIIYFLN